MSIHRLPNDLLLAQLPGGQLLLKVPKETASQTQHYLWKCGSGAPSGTADAAVYFNYAENATASTRVYVNVGGVWTAQSDIVTLGGTIATGKTLDAADADAIRSAGIIIPQYIYKSFQWSIATQMISSTLFTAERAMQLVGATEVHGVVAGQACKLLVEKCTSTTAPGSGTGLLTNNTNTGFDMTATANTVQTGTLTATTADLQFAAGDRCTVKWGTSTSCVGAALSLVFKAI